MIYQVGTLTFEDYGLGASGIERRVVGDFAEHALIGERVDFEFSGPGKDPIEISGRLMPFHEEGLSDLELAEALCTSGQPQFVMRGDGSVRGWHVIREVRSRDSEVSPVGIGFVVEHEMRLERCRDPDQDVGADLIGALISLFE